MAKYKSKPVEIEAIRFMGVHDSDIEAFTEGTAQRVWVDEASERVALMRQAPSLGYKHAYEIETLEGKMLAMPGDWIIKGTEGEFYPCKDVVFQRKYEAI